MGGANAKTVFVCAKIVVLKNLVPCARYKPFYGLQFWQTKMVKNNEWTPLRTLIDAGATSSYFYIERVKHIPFKKLEKPNTCMDFQGKNLPNKFIDYLSNTFYR